jgi:hypothetical protein
MANEADDIVVNVVLTGNEEVAQAFDKMRDAGETAFESINKALEHSLFSFTGLTTILAGAAAAVATIGVGMFAFTKSSAESVAALSDLADQLGTTTEEMSGLRAAFAAGGVSAGLIEQSFRHMALVTQQTWTEIKKQSREGADQLKGDAISVEQAQIALQKAQQDAANTDRDRTLQRKSNINSVRDAQQHLDDLHVQSLKNAGVDTSQLEQQLQGQRELNELASARLALEQARKRQRDDADNAENEARQKILAAEKAELDLNAARRKADDDRKNNIDNITDAIKKLNTGDKDALKSVNASAENIVKGIINAAAQGDDALSGLKNDITDLASPAPKAISVFDQLTKALSNMDDATQKSAVAQRFLGRSVSQAEINVLSSSEKMTEFRKRVDELGLGIDKVDKHVSENFREALFGLQSDIEFVSAKLATAFGPGFTQILKALDEALIANRASLIAFANTIAQAVVPVIESFIRVLSGAPDAAKDQWLIDYIDKLAAFGRGISDIVSLIATLISKIVAFAGGIGDVINSIFGTSLNAFDILFAAWLLRITTGFIAARAAAESAATGINVAFAAVALRFGVIGVAIEGLVLAWQGLQELTNGDGKLGTSLKGLEDRLHAIREFFDGDFKKGLEDFKKASTDQAAAEKAIDDNKKKAANEKKQRENEEAKAAREALVKEVNEHEKSNDEKSESDKKAADNKIANDKRAADAGKQALDANKRANEDAKKQEQTEGHIFGIGATVKGQTPGGIIDVEKELADRQRRFDASKEGKFTQDDTQFIQARRIDPSDVTLPAPRPDFAAQRAEQVEIQKEGVQRGIEAAQTVKPSLGEIPLAPEQTETQKSFFTNTVHDFLAKAFADPGALQEKVRPEPPPPPPPTPLPDVGQSALTTAIESLVTQFNTFINSFQNKDNTVTDQGTLGVRGEAPLSEDIQQTAGAADAAATALNSLVTAANNAAASLGSVGASSAADATVSAAGGGYIRGPGGPTGDKIHAMVSDEEYIHQAAATRFWGLDFMHAINNMRMPRFSAGGLVGLFSPQVPRFRDGGMVSIAPSQADMQHLGTVDLTTDHGSVRVAVGRDGLNQLRRAAVMRNMGASPKPSWVK